MSFDLFFVPRPTPGTSWAQAVEQHDTDADQQRSPTAEDTASWDRIFDAVKPLLPGLTVFEGPGFRELDNGTGPQIHLFPGEISLSVPYWHTGQEAERVVEELRQVAAAIEEVTGLVTYDPQADAPFLEDGINEAIGTFDRVDAYMRDELQAKTPGQPERSRWAFWRR